MGICGFQCGNVSGLFFPSYCPINVLFYIVWLFVIHHLIIFNKLASKRLCWSKCKVILFGWSDTLAIMAFCFSISNFFLKCKNLEKTVKMFLNTKWLPLYSNSTYIRWDVLISVQTARHNPILACNNMTGGLRVGCMNSQQLPWSELTERSLSSTAPAS